MSAWCSCKYVSVAAFLVGLMSFSSPASAGFQWVAPKETVAAPDVTAPPSPQQAQPSFAPVGGAGGAAPEIISPVVITGSPAPASPPQALPVLQASPAPQAAPPVSALEAPAPVAPQPPQGLPVFESSAPAAPQSLQPVQPLRPAVPPVPASASAPAVPADNSIVVGFAHSVPLAVALRQILPNGYAFSIDQDVDMGTLVSFQGGHPWRDTLRDALAPVGLVSHEQGQLVVIGSPVHGAGMAPVPSKPALSPPPSRQPHYRVGMEPRDLTSSVSVGVASPSSSAPPSPPFVAPPIILGGGPVSAPVVQEETWSAERGDRLRAVLDGWCHRSGIEFDWLSEYDYPLQASVSYAGNFEGAVRTLLTGFEGAHPQPVAELHSNPSLGQKVLVVQTRGNTNTD